MGARYASSSSRWTPIRPGSSSGGRWRGRRRGGGSRWRGWRQRCTGEWKDASEAWAAGVLAVGSGPAAAGIGSAAASELPEDVQELWQERAAIMAADGHVPRAAAERLTWANLHAERAPR